MDEYSSMDYPAIGGNNPPSTKKELQGPRPTPLKVRKDSHKIKKPPLQQQSSQQQQVVTDQYYYRRPVAPVIIYTVSPKVIHTDPNDFMTLVQRLTGSSSSSSSSYDYYYSNNNNDHKIISTTGTISSSSSYRRDGEVSPAARYATMEKAKSASSSNINRETTASGYYNFNDDASAEMRRSSSSSNLFQAAGILSPGPTSLARIQTDCLFSPITSRGTFFHDLSSPFNNQHHQHEHEHAPLLAGYIDHQDHQLSTTDTTATTLLNSIPNYSPHFFSPAITNIITSSSSSSPIHSSIDLYNHFFHYY